MTARARVERAQFDAGGMFIALAGVLSAFGVLMVFSTTAQQQTDLYVYLFRQLMFLGAGLMVCFLVVHIPAVYIRRATVPFLALTVILLVAVLFSRQVKGAHRWLALPLVGTVQPGELAKLSVVLFTAWYADRFRGGLACEFSRSAVLLGTVAVVCMLILMQPDIGIPFVIATAVWVMLLFAGVRKQLLAGLVGVGIAVIGIAILFAPHRVKRMTAFMDPWRYQTGDGYQLVQSYLSLSYGHLTGRGIGNSQFKEYYLPEAHTDFIFAIIGEELGFIGTVTLVVLFALFFFLGARLAEQVHNNYAALVIYGLVLTIVLQAYVNFGVVTGLLPTKGLGLPFISYGGSSLLTNLLAVGIIVGLWRQYRVDGGSRKP